MKKQITWSIKVGISVLLAIILLSLFTFIYNYSGVHIRNTTGATDYKWEPQQLRTNLKEGFVWNKMDDSGFNNISKEQAPIDILLMGSSHMEAVQIPTAETVCSLLNKKIPDLNTYNIGMSGHTIYQCISNLPAAIQEYHPKNYVVIETATISLDCAVMDQVNHHTLEKILSYDNGILYTMQKKFPAIKDIYQQLDLWKNNSQGNENFNAKDIIKTEETKKYQDTLNIFLKNAASTADAENIKLIIFYQPPTVLSADGMLHYDTNTRNLKLFSKICKENGITFVDMSDDFKKLYKTEHKLAHGFPNTAVGVGHLNKYGHQKIAERLAITIEKDREEH